MVFALALVVSLSGAFVVAASSSPMAGAATEDQINTLRIYGKGNLSANFPYSDFQAPFAPQSSEAPEKDFIQWNPAFLDHSDDESAGIYGSFYSEIVANEANANEKVHLRQWYVPAYCEPSGIVPANQGAVTSYDIVKEYTYLLLDSDDNNPIPGKPGVTSFVLPISDQDRIPELYPEIGLDDFDADDDGNADIVDLNHIGTVESAFGPPMNTTYGFTPCVTDERLVNADNQIVDGTMWMDISVDLTVHIGDEIRFYDHAFTISAFNIVGARSITGDLSYSGNAEDNTDFTDIIVYQGETLSAGRHKSDVNVEDLTADTAAVGIASPDAPPSQSESFIAGESYLRLIKEPWYLQVVGTVGATEANVRVGRLMVEGEAFFVDGAEYEIARIYTVCSTNSTEADLKTEVEDEFIGIGDDSEVIFGPVTFASCNTSYFADCDRDGDVDVFDDTDPSPDVTVKVDGVPADATIDKENGTVNITVVPGNGELVTIDYCYYPYAFKYITIRNGLPKETDVFLDELSVTKTAVQACPENLPLLPPFIFEHDIIDDTNIPDAFTFDGADTQDCPLPDVQLPDNVVDVDDLDSPYGYLAGNASWGKFTNDDRPGEDDTLTMVSCSATMGESVFTWVETGDNYGDVTFLPFNLNTIAERQIEDVDSVEECWVQEEKEPRFDTNLLEEKFLEPNQNPTPTPAAEEWQWINIETMPWLYTEMQLPLQPDITDVVNGDDGDYILVSSWLTEDSTTVALGENTTIRMKFVYDAHVDAVNSADIYVNDGIYNTEYNDMDDDPGTVIETASLRVYGKCNLSAAFPYDSYLGPFDLTSDEAPEKDFIQWSPAYMLHTDNESLGVYGDLFNDIEASNINANQKVHLRQWYVPKYTEPSGMVWYNEVDASCVVGPSIIKEYTYILLDPDNNPVAGQPGMSALVLPVADQTDQIGLDDVDVNGDGIGDITHLETVSSVDPDGWTGSDDLDALWPPYDLTEAYDCLPDGVLTNDANNILEFTNWIDVSTGRMNVVTGDEIRFFDHAVTVGTMDIATQLVNLDIKFIGRRYQQDGSTTSKAVEVGETLSAGRHSVDVEILTGSPSLPPSMSDEFKMGSAAGGADLELVQQPFYVQVLGIADGYANIVVGRLLVEGESFFVDGAEYEIPRINIVPTPSEENDDLTGPHISEYGLKYITIRSDLPKFDDILTNPTATEIDLGGMSIWKMRIAPCYDYDTASDSPLPMLPPFNMLHDMVDDVNIPEDTNNLEPDDQDIDNDTSSLIAPSYDLISERVMTDVPAIDECWKDEGKEPRFDTNLLEEKFTENGTTFEELWRWKNIETMPWDYTEFVLPALPDKPTETPYNTGDYILVSSFITEDSDHVWPDATAVRVKFVYDVEYQLLNPDKTGVYVNTVNVCEAWPTADAGGPYAGVTGGTLNLSGSASGASAPYSYAWDLDNDGQYDDSAIEDPTGVVVNTWWTVGSNTIGLKVTDDSGCVGYDTATVTITDPPECPDPIEIDASPALLVYPGPDCDLPEALTNIAGSTCTAITVWGVEGGSWRSYDVALSVGTLGSYGLDMGQAYVVTHTDCLGDDWVMCCDW